MGYTLTIGEAFIDVDKDDGYVRLDARSEKHDDAPSFGEPTDNTNERWPSYTSWCDAMHVLGLADMMFGYRYRDFSLEWMENSAVGYKSYDKIQSDFEYPMLQEHPGCSLIMPVHVEIIKAALSVYKQSNGGKVAGYCKCKNCDPMMGKSERDCVSDKFDFWLPRGEWLLWWSEWALASCEVPVFVNT